MKKIYFILILIIILPFSNFGQKLNIGIDVGYGLGHNEFSFGDGSITVFENQDRLYKSVTHSFGKGFNYGLFLDYEFSKMISTSLSLSFLNGDKEFVRFNYLGEEEVFTMEGENIRISPGIKMRLNLRTNYFYIRLGAIYSFLNEFKYYEIDSAIDQEIITKFNKGYSFGVTGGIGYSFRANQFISLFTEIRFYSQSFSPHNREVIKYVINGQDILDDLEVEYRYTEFVSKYKYNANEVNSNEPSVRLKQNYSFGSIGLNFGVVYTIE